VREYIIVNPSVILIRFWCHLTFDLESNYHIFIFPIAIAYSMGWDRLQNRFASVCQSVRLWALSRSHFFIDFHQNWHRRKKPQETQDSRYQVFIIIRTLSIQSLDWLNDSGCFLVISGSLV